MDIIVCIDKNNGIGKDGGLLFRIPEDMAYFRRMTVNKTVIMAAGRDAPGEPPQYSADTQ